MFEYRFVGGCTGHGETGGFPIKWISSDGLTLHLIFSGDDSFSVRRAVFHLVSSNRPVEGASEQRG